MPERLRLSYSAPLFLLLSSISCVPTLSTPVSDLDQGMSISEIAEKSSNAVVLVTNLGFNDSPQAIGSGFLVQPNGMVVTNYHVIQNSQAVTVKLPDGREFRAEGVVGSDAEQDIAVLKLNATGLPSIPLGDSDHVKVGQHVIAIGNPLGLLENTVSDGIISAIRLDNDPNAKVQKLLQITAPVSQGSSGGPLFDLSGSVIGVTFAVIELGQNLNFAIPINSVKPFINDVLAMPFNVITNSLLLPAVSECPAIGNSKSGIYHLPGGQYYAQMQFSESAICFKSEQEAMKNGYRRSMR